jgi:hypothetical protein
MRVYVAPEAYYPEPSRFDKASIPCYKTLTQKHYFFS